MGYFNLDKDSAFSENIGTLSYVGTAGSDVSVTVRITFNRTSRNRETQEFSYSVKIPDTGEIKFDLSSIMRPFYKLCASDLDGDILGGNEPFINITATESSDSVQWEGQRLIIGGYDSEAAGAPDDETVAQRIFLTRRPQVDETVPGLKQFLRTPINCTINGTGYLGGKKVICKIWFLHSSPITVELYDESGRGPSLAGRPQAVYDYIMFSADFNGVKQLAEAAGIEDEIVAYDLWGIALSDLPGENNLDYAPYPQRFVLHRPKTEWSYFLFQNRLGGADTLIAKGRTKVLEEGEPEIFINNDVEHELCNGSRTYYETNTGYVRSREYRDMWFDFFKSPSRFRTWLDGDIREIVLDEWSAEYDDAGEPSAFTFKWHMSEKDKAKVSARGELDDYYPEFSSI